MKNTVVSLIDGVKSIVPEINDANTIIGNLCVKIEVIFDS